MGCLFYEWHHNIKMQIASTATRVMRPKRFHAVYFWPLQSGFQRITGNHDGVPAVAHYDRSNLILHVPCQRIPLALARGVNLGSRSEPALTSKLLIAPSRSHLSYMKNLLHYCGQAAAQRSIRQLESRYLSSCLIRSRRQADRHGNSQLPLINQCAQLLYQHCFTIGESSSRHDCLGKR